MNEKQGRKDEIERGVLGEEGMGVSVGSLAKGFLLRRDVLFMGWWGGFGWMRGLTGGNMEIGDD